MSTLDERKLDPIKEMRRVAHNFLDLELWKFKESYRSDKSGTLIYNSALCRVNLTWGGWDPIGGNSINIFYGRLHAPNEQASMIWNDEECRCWHDVDIALHFLDGQTSSEAARLDYSHPITDPFYKEEFRAKFPRQQPEWLAQMHVTIWRHYGKRFFELFDLRQPDLWEKYRQFLKEVYDIQGRRPYIKPPLDKVC